MSLRLKFNLVLAGVLLLAVLGAGAYVHRFLQQSAIEEVQHNSQIMMHAAMAIRDYTTELVKPHLDVTLAEKFLPQTVPAYAATETLRRLQNRFPGYEYKEAVLNPTNLRDRANEWEERIISDFREGRADLKKEVTGEVGEGMHRAMYVARPITIKQPQCMACHSTPAVAPPTMLKVYGDKNGFGWGMNETVGIQVVKVPMYFPLEKARQTFNTVMTALIGSFVLLGAIYAVRYTIGIPVWGDVMNKSTIANIHTLSSVAAMLLFLPFSSVLSKLAMLTVPNSAEEAQEMSMPVLDERLFKSPAVALQQAKSAVVKMSRRAARNVSLSTPLLLKMDEDVVSAINVRENLIDRMEVEISNYLIKMTDQELGDDESHAVTELLNFVTEFERIGDYAVNIQEKAVELYEKEASFSDIAKNELKLLDSALEQILTRTNDAFENDDIALARQVEPLEEVIDILVEKLRDGHIKRLKDGICSIDTGVVFLDVLNNVERISDHCSNVAARLVGTSEGDDYDSHTLKSLMHHNPSKEYSLMYEECCKEYLTPLAAMEKDA